MEKQDIRLDFRSGVGLESRIGEPDGADEVGAVGEIVPDGRVLLVHSVAAGHERHDAAHAQLVERLGEKIIVYCAGDGRVAGSLSSDCRGHRAAHSVPPSLRCEAHRLKLGPHQDRDQRANQHPSFCVDQVLRSHSYQKRCGLNAALVRTRVTNLRAIVGIDFLQAQVLRRSSCKEPLVLA